MTESNNDDSKSIFASKTWWMNVLGPIFAFLTTKYGLNLDADTQAQVVLIFMAVANIVMRRFTNRPVTILPSPSN